jgi:hypothetical protein
VRPDVTREHFTRVTLSKVWEAYMFLLKVCNWHCSFVISNRFQLKKIAIFRLGISAIQIWTHLVKYYQYFTHVTHSNVWRNVPLFWMCASDIVPYVIQIDFKWKTCYIPPGNKEQARGMTWHNQWTSAEVNVTNYEASRVLRHVWHYTTLHYTTLQTLQILRDLMFPGQWLGVWHDATSECLLKSQRNIPPSCSESECNLNKWTATSAVSSVAEQDGCSEFNFQQWQGLISLPLHPDQLCDHGLFHWGISRLRCEADDSPSSSHSIKDNYFCPWRWKQYVPLETFVSSY